MASRASSLYTFICAFTQDPEKLTGLRKLKGSENVVNAPELWEFLKTEQAANHKHGSTLCWLLWTDSLCRGPSIVVSSRLPHDVIVGSVALEPEDSL